jgi:dihydroorotate dehydrogenase electron transfer subunit
LVGGGVGIAPLLFLTQSSTDSNPLWVLVGAKTASDLILIPELFECTERLGFATEDGSKGKKGLVTDLIRPALNEFSASIIFTCGPQPMLKAIQGMGLEIPCYGFLESRLGCGCGLCLGCAVKSSRGGYYRVCKEGPVFNLKEIVL